MSTLYEEGDVKNLEDAEFFAPRKNGLPSANSLFLEPGRLPAYGMALIPALLQRAAGTGA